MDGRLKRQERGPFLGFNGDAIEITVLAGFAQSDVEGLDDFVARFGFAAGANGDLVVATITAAEGNILKLSSLRNRTLGFRGPVDPNDVHRGAAFKFIEPLAKRIPILGFDFFHSRQTIRYYRQLRNWDSYESSKSQASKLQRNPKFQTPKEHGK
jgi:hypothetical protein